MTKTYEKGFIDGQWIAFNDILGYLNTIDTIHIDKTKIYKHVMSMRPISVDERKRQWEEVLNESY